MPSKGTKESAGSPRSRPMRAVPPLTATEGEAEGLALLREVPGPLGVLLWGALRDVMLWVTTSEEERGSLFGSESAAGRIREIEVGLREPVLMGPLLTLVLMVERPAQVAPARVVYACRRIADWAEETGRPATRLAFTQALALADPSDAGLMITTARLARELGEYARAETWFRNALQSARHRDWESYVWGFVGLGVLYIRTGNLSAAGALLGRALRAAKRRRLRVLEGIAHQHLFHLATEAGQLRRAYEHAISARNAYASAPDRLKLLMADVGRFWLHLGYCSRAFRIFDCIQELAPDASLRALWAANLVRAAAGTGVPKERYERLRAHALELVGSATDRARVAECYLMIAHGDTTLRSWDRVEALATTALAVSSAAGMAELRVMAEDFLERARSCRVLEPGAGREDSVLARTAESLADELIRSVQQERGQHAGGVPALS